MAHDAAVMDEIEPRTPARGHEDISDTHARGLRRDLFHIQEVRVGRPLPMLLRRIGTVQWPHRSTRETVAVIMLPSQRVHADGQEPETGSGPLLPFRAPKGRR